MKMWNRLSTAIVLAAAGFGLALAGCGSSADTSAASPATLNLTSLPSAEVWVDGTSRGSTPVALAVAAGSHEVIMRQTGFEDFKQSVDVRTGAPQSLDATLVAKDAENPDALRKIAAAYDVSVEPLAMPELHRGAGGPDIVLLFPRNDIRREGLGTWRIDVTPEYAGGGTLEWRSGRTVLSKEVFDPATLVSVGDVPKAVLDASKVGETVTWGVYFSDSKRKPVTAQYEVVSKPQAARKLAEIDADKRLAKQPLMLREQLRAEILQNYRLYSEALSTYLEIRAQNKDSTLPHGGIVACLRRMDLEGTALFEESASKVVGKIRGRTDDTSTINGATPGVAHVPSGTTSPVSGGSGRLTPGNTLPGSGSPTTPSEKDSGATPATTPSAAPTGATAGLPTDPLAKGPADPAKPAANDATSAAADSRALANVASENAKAAEANAADARNALDAALHAANAAEKAAADHAGQADEADFARASLEAAQTAKAAREALLIATATAQAAADSAAKAAEIAAQADASAKKAGDAAPVTAPNPATATSDPLAKAKIDAAQKAAVESRTTADTLRQAAEAAKKAADAAFKASATGAADAEVARLTAEASAAAEAARIAALKAREAELAAEQAARDAEQNAGGK